MNRQITEKEAIFRYAKIFVAQYLSTIRTFSHIQTTSILFKAKR